MHAQIETFFGADHILISILFLIQIVSFFLTKQVISYLFATSEAILLIEKVLKNNKFLTPTNRDTQKFHYSINSGHKTANKNKIKEKVLIGKQLIRQ